MNRSRNRDVSRIRLSLLVGDGVSTARTPRTRMIATRRAGRELRFGAGGVRIASRRRAQGRLVPRNVAATMKSEARSAKGTGIRGAYARKLETPMNVRHQGAKRATLTSRWLAA